MVVVAVVALVVVVVVFLSGLLLFVSCKHLGFCELAL